MLDCTNGYKIWSASYHINVLWLSSVNCFCSQPFHILQMQLVSKVLSSIVRVLYIDLCKTNIHLASTPISVLFRASEKKTQKSNSKDINDKQQGIHQKMVWNKKFFNFYLKIIDCFLVFSIFITTYTVSYSTGNIFCLAVTV